MMTFLIALLIAATVFLIGYQFIYRAGVLRSEYERAAASKDQVEQIALPEADPKTPEYQLTAAGIRTGNPRLMWQAIHYGPALFIFLGSLAFGLPILIALMLSVIGYIAPRRWISGRIKDRGRRIDEELPMAYVRLASILRANPDVPNALIETANAIEVERGGIVTPLSAELRLTGGEMTGESGREAALKRFQKRAPTYSLSNLGLLLERLVETGTSSRFFAAFESAAGNVQAILEARNKAKAKASEQMQMARMLPLLMAGMTLMFLNDPSFRSSFDDLFVQLAIAAAVVMMFIGYNVMTDIAQSAA